MPMDWSAVPMVPTSSTVASWAWARPARRHPIVPVISTTVPWSAKSLSTGPGYSNAVSRQWDSRQGFLAKLVLRNRNIFKQ